VFTTDKDGSREQIDWIVSNARKDLHENGPVRHVEGKRRAYFGDSATLADQAACSYRDKRDADRIAERISKQSGLARCIDAGSPLAFRIMSPTSCMTFIFAAVSSEIASRIGA
jgi:hypothetical protein